MSTNLLTLAQNALGGDFSTVASQYLGEPAGATQSGLAALLPAVLGGIAKKGATPDGASSLMTLLNGANLDVGSLGNLGSMFGGGGAGVTALMKTGASSLVPALFGDKGGALVSALSSASGLRSSSASNLVAMVVPIVLMLIKKLIGEKGLNASSLSSLLASQGPNLQGALDSRLTGALGFASPAAFLGGLGSAASDTAKKAGAAMAGAASTVGNAGMAAGTAAAVAGKSGMQRMWPWLIGLGILALLWWLFSPKPTPPAPAATAPMPVAPAPAPAPAVVATFPARIYFETGSATIGPDGVKLIAAVADAMKKDGFKGAITGYTDKTGDTAKNEELAKNRALAVRDALKAAGVPETSLDLRPPMFVEAGAGANDAEARRVEISKL